MSQTYNITKCLARTTKDPTKQCTNKRLGTCDFCGVHLKAKIVHRIDTPLVLVCNPVPTTSLIPIQRSKRLRITNTTVTNLRHSLHHYKLPTHGLKSELFTRLQTYFNGLILYLNEEPSIIKLQSCFRNYLWKKLRTTQGPACFQVNKCVNQEDILTFDSLSEIPSHYIFSYRDGDTFIYGFDIRSVNEILKRDSENPYNRSKFSESVVNQAKEMIRLLTVLNINVTIVTELVTDPYLQMKRRAVDIFHNMDSLDQYTNVEWFLKLNLRELGNYYKEAEDIWNYRLGLSDQIKRKIAPHVNGKVFSILVSEVKSKTNIIDLQTICLDFMDTLVSSASKREDRVNGCIYALLGLVIVCREAAQALPSYYSMVSVHSNNDEIVPL